MDRSCKGCEAIQELSLTPFSCVIMILRSLVSAVFQMTEVSECGLMVTKLLRCTGTPPESGS